MRPGVTLVGPRSHLTGGLQLDLSLWDTRETNLPPGAKKVFNSYFSRLRGEETCYEIQYGLNETTLTVDD